MAIAAQESGDNLANPRLVIYNQHLKRALRRRLDGRSWCFVLGDDDYYYGMVRNGRHLLLSCVGSIEGHGFTRVACGHMWRGDPDAVEALCTTLPMMSDRRLVVIRDVESWNKKARAKTAVLRYL